MAKIRHGEAEAIVILGPKPPYLSRQSRKMHLDIPHFLLLTYFEDHSAFQVRFKTQQAFFLVTLERNCFPEENSRAKRIIFVRLQNL